MVNFSFNETGKLMHHLANDNTASRVDNTAYRDGNTAFGYGNTAFRDGNAASWEVNRSLKWL